MRTGAPDQHFLKYGYSMHQDTVGFPTGAYDDRFAKSSNIMAKGYIPVQDQHAGARSGPKKSVKGNSVT